MVNHNLLSSYKNIYFGKFVCYTIVGLDYKLIWKLLSTAKRVNSIIQAIFNSYKRLSRIEMNGCVKCVTDRVHHTQHHTVGFIEILVDTSKY